MDSQERLQRIQSLLSGKKLEEDKFEQRVRNMNDEMYSKRINPLLINYLDFTKVSMETLHTSIVKAGGKFRKPNPVFTITDYEKAYGLLTTNIKEMFNTLDADMIVKVDVDLVVDFLEDIRDIIRDLEFTNKHRDIDLVSYTFKKYLKAISNPNIINTIEKPFSHLHVKIHGIWEVMTGVSKIKGESYLLGHCTRSHASCWPIINEGLRIKGTGGRCGRGIYFSNDLSKCLGYCAFTESDESKAKYGLMFMAQVWTGKQQTSGVSSGLAAGYDTVLAVGQVSPKITELIPYSDGFSSKIYVDEPSENPEGKASGFYNNEYVVYNEDRCRLRYIVLFSRSSSWRGATNGTFYVCICVCVFQKQAELLLI